MIWSPSLHLSEQCIDPGLWWCKLWHASAFSIIQGFTQLDVHRVTTSLSVCHHHVPANSCSVTISIKSSLPQEITIPTTKHFDATSLLLQVKCVSLNTMVLFPDASSGLASSAAASLVSTLSSNPGQVYSASASALLASAAIATSNVIQDSILSTAGAKPAAQIAPGPAPVQYLLKANLVSLTVVCVHITAQKCSYFYNLSQLSFWD